MSIQARLKLLSFLQFFIWGSWLITLGSYMFKTLNFTGAQVGDVYSMSGIAACIMPFVIGYIADKYLSANKVYAICHICGGISLIIMAHVSSPITMIWIMLINLMFYIPSIGMTHSIAHFCIKQDKRDTMDYYPAICTFGTIGFIVAMWVVSLLHLELSNIQLYIAAAASFCVALYGLTLPHMPASREKGQNGVNFLSAIGSMLREPRMAVFFLFAIFLGVVMHLTNTFGNPFLHDLAETELGKQNLMLRYPDILYSLSQISEIGFILTIPFVLKKFGIKTVLLISAFAWTMRFGLFAFGGASASGMGMLLLSMIVYGCAFDFFTISSSIFVEKTVPEASRFAGQGLLMVSMNGFGTFIGMYAGGRIVDYFTQEGLRNWHGIWLVFAAYSALLFFLFLLCFKGRKSAGTAL